MLYNNRSNGYNQQSGRGSGVYRPQGGILSRFKDLIIGALLMGTLLLYGLGCNASSYDPRQIDNHVNTVVANATRTCEWNQVIKAKTKAKEEAIEDERKKIVPTYTPVPTPTSNDQQPAGEGWGS